MINSIFIPLMSRCNAADLRADVEATNCVKKHIPIVLIHGWGCDSHIWESSIPFLNKYADIITLDIFYRYKNVDECCAAIAEHLPEACILCGWSLGGMLATRLAGLYPLKIKGLITLASNVSFVANKKWPHAMAADVFAAFSESFSLEPKKALLRFSLLQVKGDPEAKKQLAALKKCASNDESLLTGLEYLSVIDNTQILSEQVICPALLVFGEKDILVPLSAVHEMKNIINKYQEVFIIANKGHVLPYIDNRKDNVLVIDESKNKVPVAKKNEDLMSIVNTFLENKLFLEHQRIVTK
jgi:pimeloyl-ACP methyl ester esterase